MCFYGISPSYGFQWKRTHTNVCVCEALVSYVQIQCMFQFASYNLKFYSIAVMVIGTG